MTLNEFTTPWGVTVKGYARDDTSDFNTLASCIKEDEYRVARLPENGVAIDLGGHIGACTLALASRGWTVNTVEMLPDNLEILHKNLEINGFNNVRVYPNAINSTNEHEVSAFYSDTSTVSGKAHEFIGTIVPRLKNNQNILTDDGREIKVQPITLSQVFKASNIDRCNFLKVDIEGSEWDIFENISNDLLKRIDRIAIEIDGARDHPTSTQDFMKFLKGHFVDVSQEYFPDWCAPGTWVHGYYINKKVL